MSLVASDAAYKDTNAFLGSCGFRNVRTETIVKNADPMDKTLPHPIKVTFGYKNGTLSSKPTYRFAVGGWGRHLDCEWKKCFPKRMYEAVK